MKIILTDKFKIIVGWSILGVFALFLLTIASWSPGITVIEFLGHALIFIVVIGGGTSLLCLALDWISK